MFLGQLEAMWPSSGDSVVWSEDTTILTVVAAWFQGFGVKWGK